VSLNDIKDLKNTLKERAAQQIRRKAIGYDED